MRNFTLRRGQRIAYELSLQELYIAYNAYGGGFLRSIRRAFRPTCLPALPLCGGTSTSCVVVCHCI